MRRGFCGVLLALSMLIAGPSHADTLRVAAAANLQQVFTKGLLPAFTQSTGIAVTPAFGSTKLLASQVENGAPIDVFVAADKGTPDRLADKGILDKSTEFVYAFGKLVLWSRKDAPAHPASVADLAKPEFTRIAVANPKLAPYGAAAMAMLGHAHLTSALQPKIVYAENIAQTLQYARSGNASVAVTALSLVIDDRTDPYVVVPAGEYPPIAQAAAMVHNTKEPADARKFLDFLSSPAARAIWKQYGYGLPQ